MEPKRKVGRPPKKTKDEYFGKERSSNEVPVTTTDLTPRRRGRPSKAEKVESRGRPRIHPLVSNVIPLPRPRGRPPKNKTAENLVQKSANEKPKPHLPSRYVNSLRDLRNHKINGENRFNRVRYSPSPFRPTVKSSISTNKSLPSPKNLEENHENVPVVEEVKNKKRISNGSVKSPETKFLKTDGNSRESINLPAKSTNSENMASSAVPSDGKPRESINLSEKSTNSENMANSTVPNTSSKVIEDLESNPQLSPSVEETENAEVSVKKRGRGRPKKGDPHVPKKRSSSPKLLILNSRKSNRIRKRSPGSIVTSMTDIRSMRPIPISVPAENRQTPSDTDEALREMQQFYGSVPSEFVGDFHHHVRSFVFSLKEAFAHFTRSSSPRA